MMRDVDSNITSVNQTTGATTTNVADAVFDKKARLVVLYVQIALGAVGSTLVCVWLWINRRRTSRVNTIIRNLAAADILVISFACVMQVRPIDVECLLISVTTASQCCACSAPPSVDYWYNRPNTLNNEKQQHSRLYAAIEKISKSFNALLQMLFTARLYP